MRKSFIQLALAIVCILSTYLVYKSFFDNKSFVQEEGEININSENISISQSEEKINPDEKEKNLITNLKYKSFDAIGNEYLINSKSAEISSKNDELIKLIDVSAKGILKKSLILIKSDNTIHNKNTFDTKFYGNVKVAHEDIKIFQKILT